MTMAAGGQRHGPARSCGNMGGDKRGKRHPDRVLAGERAISPGW